MAHVAPKPRSWPWLFRIRGSYRRKYILLALIIVILLRVLINSFKSAHNKIQFQFSTHSVLHTPDPDLNIARAEAVRAEFKWAVGKYKDAAWGKDEVLPVSGGFQTTRNGFAATLIDSLTTAMVMNLTTEVVQALDYVVNTLDFDKDDGTLVDPFETTIRYLGSLVSAVDILDAGTLVGPIPRQSRYRESVLQKAIKLAEKLAPAFDSPLGIPWPRVNFTAHLGVHEPDSLGDIHLSRDISPAVSPARAGSNWLEYYRLSQQAMDPVYTHNATRGWASLVWNRNEETFDGLVDSPMDSFSGFSLGHTVSLGAGHDSYYEYLIKAAQLAPRDKHASTYRKRWEQAMTSTMERLAFRGTPPDSYRADGKRSDSGYLFITQYFDGTYMNEMGHLTCYVAGNLILGGRYLERNDLVAFGLEVLETCHATYVTATGLGPESFVWEPPRRDPSDQVLDGGYEQVRWAISAPGPHEHEQVRKLGFWVSDARYFLRPEVIEGYFYAYRITGDPKYQDWAWTAFEGLRKFCKAQYGYGEIQDVTLPDGGGPTVDSSESFFLAETLKYLFLIFDDPDRLSLDEWVLSTEAHPFRIE
ncbi:glycoside hydrolase [Lipomyces tetrasporus]|uniref:alpha-1,2-Mannosidase n=1 Tax=Lipomyces tetrasporus TaxID=54092 RepID=A0AAD7QTK4_9ASCO|nr:glycoside hydrolase [Lipomyces tetrasporus]KAJ8099467.1 glycoside hydrolase [Lipomyces tetrasporus]